MTLQQLAEEIRDILLDSRTTVHAQEVDDGSGRKYVDYELESTIAQEIEVMELIGQWAGGLADRIFKK
jgi:hypothetical protein